MSRILRHFYCFDFPEMKASCKGCFYFLPRGLFEGAKAAGLPRSRRWRRRRWPPSWGRLGPVRRRAPRVGKRPRRAGRRRSLSAGVVTGAGTPASQTFCPAAMPPDLCYYYVTNRSYLQMHNTCFTAIGSKNFSRKPENGKTMAKNEALAFHKMHINQKTIL